MENKKNNLKIIEGTTSNSINESKSSFEECIEELELIVEKIELGQLTLDENLEMYEKGMKLVRMCTQKLTESEFKIEQIMKENGRIKTVPFNINMDE